MSVQNFLSDQSDENETDNGSLLQNVYLPEEVLIQILSFVDPKELLQYTLVCRKWNRIIKSYALWSTIYKRTHNRRPKHLPWYLYYCLLSTNYFDNNLLKNGNGQENFEHWEIKSNGGDQFTIENPPLGADMLPLNVPEFENQTSCFVTSYGRCNKLQKISLGKSKLFQHILNDYKPHIYASEWTAGRFDCGCIYALTLGFLGSDFPNIAVKKPCAMQRIKQWEGSKWEKMELIVTDYPENVQELIFEHSGCDTQFWAGHYGSKMAGGVLKLLWDSINPLLVDEKGIVQKKRFSKFEFTATGLSETERQQYERSFFQNLWYAPQFNLDDEDAIEIYGSDDDSSDE